MSRRPDPVTLEVYRQLFAAVAEEMGATLRRSACSPNIKERRDYSCAVFDARGRMLAQGENIPVHLGSMPASVAAALSECSPAPGDVVILNDPYRGGTHLPDITMVAAVDDGTGAAGFHVAVRAHHADVGGSTPGSMPLARELLQEGLVLPPVFWRRGGRAVEDVRRLLLANVRTRSEREGDLDAQEAALAVGARGLAGMLERRGRSEVQAYGGHLRERARKIMAAHLGGLPDGTWDAEDVMEDDGLGQGPFRIAVRLTLKGETALVDFQGTDPPAQGGINAVPAIVISAVHYIFRCLLPQGSPANAGLFEPIEVRVPENCLLNPPAGAAVAAGNVETSQRVVDVVQAALAAALPGQVPAASQGTMNNVALGGVNPRTGTAFTYYETLAGGHGGGPRGPGMSGRHSHMTNSLNTPVEALEHALPLRVEEYSLRAGTGGRGRHPGGEGLMRTYRFLAPVTVSVLSERRATAPPGRHGGGDGAPGRNRLLGADGSRRELPAKFTATLEAGEALEVSTPGGGGWGTPESGT